MNYEHPHRHIWLRRICQAAAIGLLASGFAIKGYWLGGLAVIGLVTLGWVGERFQKPWLSSAVLLAGTGIAAGGIWIGVSPILMIFAEISALAWSELTGNPTGNIHPRNPIVCARVEQQRFRHLVVLIVGSLLVTGVGLSWQWHLSFATTFIIAIFVGSGLFGLFRILKNLHP